MTLSPINQIFCLTASHSVELQATSRNSIRFPLHCCACACVELNKPLNSRTMNVVADLSMFIASPPFTPLEPLFTNPSLVHCHTKTTSRFGHRYHRPCCQLRDASTSLSYICTSRKPLDKLHK